MPHTATGCHCCRVVPTVNGESSLDPRGPGRSRVFRQPGTHAGVPLAIKARTAHSEALRCRRRGRLIQRVPAGPLTVLPHTEYSVRHEWPRPCTPSATRCPWVTLNRKDCPASTHRGVTSPVRGGTGQVRGGRAGKEKGAARAPLPWPFPGGVRESELTVRPAPAPSVQGVGPVTESWPGTKLGLEARGQVTENGRR